MSLFKYCLLGVGILLLLTAGLVAGFLFLGKDELPPNDSDLWLPKLEIKEEENGYYYFNQLSEKIYQLAKQMQPDLVNDMIEGKNWDTVFVKELLADNEEIFYYFEKTLQTSSFHNPYLLDPKDISVFTNLVSYSGLRNIARLYLLRAELFSREGKGEEALVESLKIIKVGDMLEEGRNGLVGYLTGTRIKGLGVEEFRRLLIKVDLSAGVLKKYTTELNEFYFQKEGLENTVKLEYIDFVNTKEKLVDSIARAGFFDEKIKRLEELEPWWERILLRSDYFYKPNQTKQIFVEYFRDKINDLSKKYYKETKNQEPQNFNLNSWWKILSTENSVGKSLYDTTITSQQGLLTIKYSEEFSIMGTQLLMALKAFSLDKGRLPDNLNELVPAYLASVPNDPFDGESIRYSKEKKIIYSVGKDLIDTGGSEGEDWQTMPDPTFKI